MDDSTKTPAQLAAAEIDGREYPFIPTAEERAAWKEAGLFVLWGDSDDLLKLRGVEHDAIGAYGGTGIRLCPDGFLFDPETAGLDSKDALCALRMWEARKAQSIWIKAIWDDRQGWRIETPLGQAAGFRIMEFGKPQSCGVVIAAENLPKRDLPTPADTPLGLLSKLSPNLLASLNLWLHVGTTDRPGRDETTGVLAAAIMEEADRRCWPEGWYEDPSVIPGHPPEKGGRCERSHA